MGIGRSGRVAAMAACTLLGGLGAASARDGFAAPGRGHGPGWHGPRPGHHRPFVPLYLDRSTSDRVVVNIRQTFNAPPVSPLGAIPSVADLPTVVGIRRAEPAQPVVYVLNEERPRPGAAPRTVPRPGARILSVDPDVPATDLVAEEQVFGPRIIHLTVPVGRRY
ncbi:MAG TPA: hypothetical protein VIL09_16885 [Microvirga sp.]